MIRKTLKGDQRDVVDSAERDFNPEHSKITSVDIKYEDSTRNTENMLCLHWRDHRVNVVQ